MQRPRIGLIQLVLATALSQFPEPSLAHGAIHEQIASVTGELEKAPTDAALYLKRAELHRAERSWAFALADYDRAARLAPELRVVDLARSRALLEADRAADALAPIDRFIEGEGDSSAAHELRGRILATLGRSQEAVDAFDRALTLLVPSAVPEPELYIQRARALTAADRKLDAIASLDEGSERLGHLVVFDLLAIELERREGRFDQALARVDTSLASANRKERWWLLRGEIQRQAGRAELAQHDFERALAAIESLPSRQRKTRRSLELESRIRSVLADVAKDPR